MSVNLRSDPWPGYSVYLPIFVPAVLFLVSLYIRPAMNPDSGIGFLALRSMLEGGAFNSIGGPDQANISADSSMFLAWFSPGQYLIPGFFVWLGTDYGLALCLTTFISTLAGVLGWAQVARSFGVSRFVLLLFVLGLASYRHVTFPFRMYNGGEVLLFAAAPWCFYWLMRAVNTTPVVCFVISLMAAACLFTAKLTGLVVFAATVVGLTFVETCKNRRLTRSTLMMLAASAVAATLFVLLWLARGSVPASGAGLALTWHAILFPVAAAAFSGFSGLDLVSWLLLHPTAPVFSDLGPVSYIAGPLALLLMAWTWYRLRATRYRPMAITLFAIIAVYTFALAAMYLRGSALLLEERNLRFAGILFLLLLLTSLDQGPNGLAKSVAVIGVCLFAVYGITSYIAGARQLVSGNYYDRHSGTSQQQVSPIVLEYLRSVGNTNAGQRPVAVIPSQEAAVGLPGFRLIALNLDTTQIEILRSGGPMMLLPAHRWAGRAEKIFVIVQSKMVDNGKANALLRCFVDYPISKWERRDIDGMIVYSQ